MNNDNLSGIKFDRPIKWLLLPGVVIQWLMYMFPKNSRLSIVMTSRHSRSPIMILFYSCFFWLCVTIAVFSIITQ